VPTPRSAKYFSEVAIRTQVYILLPKSENTETRQVHDDDTLHNLEQSIELLKELVRSQREQLRQVEHERDLLLAWYRASNEPSLASAPSVV
jgi:hypothetical protein